MKLLLDIPDSKAFYLLQLLHDLPFIKTKTLTDSKALLMEEMREAVEEMKLIKAGKKEARNVEDLLNEL